MTYTVNPEITATALQDELVLLDPRTSLMYTLNAVGKLVWEHLRGGQATLSGLIRAVTEEFDVTEETARQDVERLLAELQVNRLLKITPER